MNLVNLLLIGYVLLVVIFLIASFFIFRHTMHYGYLSNHFKTIVAVFGLIALVVILFSSFLMAKLYTGASPSPSSNTSSGSINY